MASQCAQLVDAHFASAGFVRQLEEQVLIQDSDCTTQTDPAWVYAHLIGDISAARPLEDAANLLNAIPRVVCDHINASKTCRTDERDTVQHLMDAVKWLA